MATTLTKPVVRKTAILDERTGKPWLVTLDTAVFRFRVHGERTEYVLPIREALVMAWRIKAEVQRHAKNS